MVAGDPAGGAESEGLMAVTRHEPATEAGSVFLVHFTGEYDTGNASELTGRITRAANQSFSSVVVDLSEVTFFDSTAIRALVRSHAELERAGKTMFIGCVSQQVRRVLELTGVWETLAHYPSGDAASAG
jgi:anti-anti-sigma factor